MSKFQYNQLTRQLVSASAFCLYMAMTALTTPSFASSTHQSSHKLKEIQLIIPYPPGGEADKTARELAPLLSNSLGGIPVTTEQKVGENGLVANRHILQAKPDGSVLMVGRIGNLTLTPILANQSPPDWKRMSMIGILEFNPVICVVSSKSEITQIQHLIDSIKRNPGALKFGMTGGIGSIYNFFVVYMLRTLGLRFDAAKPVDFVSTSDAVQGLIDRKIDFFCSNSQSVAPAIKRGAVRPILTNAPGQISDLPIIPLAADHGLRELNKVVGWAVLVGPPGMSKETVTQLRVAMNKIVTTQDWQKGGLRFGTQSSNKSHLGLEQFLSEQSAFYENLAILTRLIK